MPRTKTDPAPPPRHYLHTPLTVADLLAGCERIGADPATTTVHINGEPVADSSSHAGGVVVRSRGAAFVDLGCPGSCGWDED